MNANSNPDTAFQVNPDLNPDPGFLKPKTGKKIQLKKCRGSFLIKNCNLLIPRPPLKMSKLHEKPSAPKREHPTLQEMK